MAESFLKTLKRELVNGRHYETREGAKQDIFKYIELYYNTKRTHSALGYKSPGRVRARERLKMLKRWSNLA